MPREMPHKDCARCNAGMPPFRVNPLCEECFAEESDEYDAEYASSCDECGIDIEWGELCDQCEWLIAEAEKEATK